jgi:hypothetical protein
MGAPLLYPEATERLVPYTTAGAFAPIGLVLHVQAGDGSPYSWFANPADSACSHWWVSKTGAVEQYLDARARSWAQAAGNGTYHAVETEGQPTEALTPSQVAALADLYRWGHATFGWPLELAEQPGQPGFGWHGMGGVAWGNHPGCPGDLRKAQRQAILAAAGQEGTVDIDPPILVEPSPDDGRRFVFSAARGLRHITCPAELYVITSQNRVSNPTAPQVWSASDIAQMLGT